ncbi:MAG: hypothetical protein WC666_01020 [Candidatus Paceibacterota bacterium]|jgi:predicted GH43/DUF377 family glycosyl hydrolase
MAEFNPFFVIILSFLALLAGLVLIHKERINSASKKKNSFILDRNINNPILSPQSIREWEHGGTFNPAAIKDDEGKVHLLYRAVGADGISRVGYAMSKNGQTIDSRSSHPVFEPQRGYGMPDPKNVTGPKTYNPAFYTSGGGWGGSEDPRAVLIDGKVYMTYVAFEGWDSTRIALTSIKIEDLKQGRWNWKKPKVISPPGQTAKNWVIFPEKINGKFAILHSIVPNIMVEYLDSIDNIPTYIDSPRLHGPQPGRKDFWDNRIRGAGPPPIKTDIGWLLLYHAQDNKEPSKYKIGAMILDANDPTKILYRSPQPILEPDTHYENDGKPGVVYASGAVVLKGNLTVYYGGGDKHVCIAETPLKQLLDWLVKYGKVE